MYRVSRDPIAAVAIDSLPQEALKPLAELVVLLELSPWSGDPINEENPNCSVLTHQFGGRGLVVYLVVEATREVEFLRVHWI